MRGLRLVIGEIAAHLLGGKAVSQQQVRHHHVALAQQLRAHDPVVGPEVIQRAGQRVGLLIVGFQQVEAVVLQVHAQLFVIRQVHPLRHLAQVGDLRGSELQPRQCRVIGRGTFRAQNFQQAAGLLQVLLRHDIGVEIVVHPLVIFIRTEHAVNLIALQFGTIKGARRPAARRLHQHVDAAFRHQVEIAGGAIA